MGHPAEKEVFELESNRNPTVIAAVIGSIIVHGLLLTTVPILYPGDKAAVPSKTKVLRVRFPEDKKKPKPLDLDGQIVDVLDDANVRERPPDNSSFLSDKNRISDQQTQARFTGPNPSRSSSAGESGQNQPQKKSVAETGRVDLSIPDTFLKKASPKKDPKPPGERHASLAPSNYLPQISFGEQTLLNTREYAYASYFIRMKRQMEAVWDPRSVLRRDSMSRNQYITVVSILLDGKGNVRKATLIQGSGNRALDERALTAVRTAGPFLNPPTGIIERDGFIHIPDWSFIVSLGRFF